MPQALEYSEGLWPKINETRRRHLLHLELGNLYGQTADLHAVYCLTQSCKQLLTSMQVLAYVTVVSFGLLGMLLGMLLAVLRALLDLLPKWRSLRTWSARRKSRLMTLGMKQCTWTTSTACSQQHKQRHGDNSAMGFLWGRPL